MQGPHFPERLNTPADISNLQMRVDVEEKLGYVFSAITLTRQQLEGKVPLIGFTGAPVSIGQRGGSKNSCILSYVLHVIAVDSDVLHDRRWGESHTKPCQGLALSPPGLQSPAPPGHHGCVCGLSCGSSGCWCPDAAGVRVPRWAPGTRTIPGVLTLLLATDLSEDKGKVKGAKSGLCSNGEQELPKITVWEIHIFPLKEVVVQLVLCAEV